MVSLNRQASGRNYYKYVVSFAVEETFWSKHVMRGLSEEAASFYRTQVIQNKTLFADWLCLNTNIQGSSIPELNFLLITLYRFGLTDDTSFTEELKAQIAGNLSAINFADYGSLLHELILTDKPNFIPMSTQKEFIKTKLSLNRVYPQKLKHFFDNPMIRLRFCKNALAQPDISADIDTAVRFYENMLKSSEPESGQCLDASLKDILETSLSLVIDFNPGLQDEIDAMIAIVQGRLVELRETDLVLFFRVLVLRRIHCSQDDPQMPRELIKEVDSRLSKYKKEPTLSILQSVAGIVKCSGICSSEDIPYLSGLVKRLATKEPSRGGKPLSASEQLILRLLEANRIKIVASNAKLLNHYSVDLLLDRKVCVEVNGYYHYTSSYIESSSSPTSTISPIHKLNPQTSLQRYRTPEAAKYLALQRAGYRIVTIDIKKYLTDPQKYQSELVSCLQSL